MGTKFTSWTLLFGIIVTLVLPGIGNTVASQKWSVPPPSFSFSSVSGSQVNLFGRRSQQWNDFSPEVRSPPGSLVEQNETCALERDWLWGEMGVWDPPWSQNNKPGKKSTKKLHTMPTPFQRDESSYNPYAILMGDEFNSLMNMTRNGVTKMGQDGVIVENKVGPRSDEDDELEEDSLGKLETTLSRVKLIPDGHHVSGFLNKGVVKRFLFVNDKLGNPFSITITPCTSILHWVVKVWSVLESNSSTTLGGPLTLKTFRTQRPTTFSVASASRGVYSVDMRPISTDSYVHLYATSSASGPSRLFFHESGGGGSHAKNGDTFIQHMFTHVEMEVIKEKVANIGAHFDQINTNIAQLSPSSNKPRIWAQRLRGNRLHVRWDTSPLNPHLMQYCLVVNSRRDYSSLCSATGERYGVLPPDLMHVTYYGEESANKGGEGLQSDEPLKRKHRHGRKRRKLRSSPSQEDLLIGCTNKKTNYILSHLVQGRLYYFNVFVRDMSTNVSLPYVRTTLKYHAPKHAANFLRDNKPLKVKLTLPSGPWRDGGGDGGVNGVPSFPKFGGVDVTTVKFNLNKPCNELAIYVMPCGGGSVVFELWHGENRTVYTSAPTDSLDVVKIAMPQKGKYFLKLSPTPNGEDVDNWTKMVEVFVAKKNRKLPIPRLPEITKLTEDESLRTCDSVTLQWWPSPDFRDNEYCIFLKEESRPRRHFTFKKPNQCDVDRSLRSDPYVTHSLCVQKSLSPETLLLSQRIVGLSRGKVYVVQLIVRRHNGKSLSYDLTVVQTLKLCSE